MKTCIHCGKPTKKKKYCSWECRYDVVARFHSFVQIPDDPSACWAWQGRLRLGYGSLQVGRKEWYAHRLSWQLKNGSIPEDMDILHSCDNPPCVNPDHLRPGTHQDNMRDMYNRERRKAASGAHNGNAKLTQAIVDAIRSEYQPRVTTLTMLARKYGVSRSAIHYIVKGEVWKPVSQIQNLQQTVSKLLTA